MTFRSCIQAVCVAAALGRGANAFVAPLTSNVATSSIDTEIHSTSMPEIKDIPYGEASRQYRRTVYTHDDWKKHRSPDRFGYYLSAMLNSGVYKNIGREVAVTTAVAVFACGWNAVFGDYQDFDGVKHAGMMKDSLIPVLGLPSTAFTLASPSLGLLLGMRSCKIFFVDI